MAAETDAKRIERHHREHMDKLDGMYQIQCVLDSNVVRILEALDRPTVNVLVSKPWYVRLFNG